MQGPKYPNASAFLIGQVFTKKILGKLKTAYSADLHTAKNGAALQPQGY